MIVSMTGYGFAEKTTDSYLIKVEVRSLNSKFLDLQLKVPKELNVLENPIRQIAEKILVRGKVALSLDFTLIGEFEPQISINETLFHAYYKKFKQLADQAQDLSPDLFKLALHSPNVLANSPENGYVVDQEAILQVTQHACQQCNKFRIDEGNQLRSALMESIEKIKNGRLQVKSIEPSRIQNIKSRINASLDELLEKNKIDTNRFEQELIYYIEKLDISEELVRLESHLSYFQEAVGEPEYSGKKLGFISQEIGREINTIGSKANDAAIQRIVVGMKDELEKIKEQLMNVL